MSGLNSTRDIARFFTDSGVTIRPEAASGILGDVYKIDFNEDKKRYLTKFLQLFKDW